MITLSDHILKGTAALDDRDSTRAGIGKDEDPSGLMSLADELEAPGEKLDAARLHLAVVQHFQREGNIREVIRIARASLELLFPDTSRRSPVCDMPLVMRAAPCYNTRMEALCCAPGSGTMQQPWVITIDGPAGSGKSTVGGLLAQQLGYVYFDTGVMYRALALVALQQQLDLNDERALTRLAQTIRIDVLAPIQDDGRQYTVLVNDADVTWDIRAPDVDRAVSLPAQVAGVRAELVRQQRAIGQRGQMVMVGRDIGTVVMPDAPVKIYLDASLEIRARRRLHEQQQQGRTVMLEQVRTDMARRDKLDQHVMQPAADALILNTDRLSPAEAVDWIVAHVQPLLTHPEVRI